MENSNGVPIQRLVKVLSELSGKMNNNNTSPTSQSSTPKKQAVSSECSNATREVYKTLQKGDSTFGYNFRREGSIHSIENELTTKRITKGVRDAHGGKEKCPFTTAEIEGACYRYFKSLRDSERRKEKGTNQRHAVTSRRQSRRRELESGYLNHVISVFERIGYAVGDNKSDWDVLWSHEYPFVQLAKKISNLKPHQKVNHFPGSGFITSKVHLAVSINPYIPRAFRIPKEKDKFLQYAEEHPDTLWVKKRNNHRGIKITNVQELDLSEEGSFVQVFVDRPFLIDGRKFDIGVYTILTSINPLRVYTIETEASIRFCSQDYYPFDARNTSKYVVRDDFTPVWKMPSLKKLNRELNFNFKESLNAYLERKGHNVRKLWRDISAAIRTVYLQKEAAIISASNMFSSSRNFFELVRFDFAVDEDLNVHLMEVNMSPNLSSDHIPRNAEMYDKVMFNLLSVVLVTRPVKNDFYKSSEDEANMRVSDKDISVFPEWCLSKSCLHSCRDEKCKLCSQCVSLTMKKTLKLAYLEHINKGNCGRVFPPKMTEDFALEWSPSTKDREFQSLNKRNKLMYMWFVGKCRQSAAWC